MSRRCSIPAIDAVLFMAPSHETRTAGVVCTSTVLLCRDTGDLVKHSFFYLLSLADIVLLDSMGTERVPLLKSHAKLRLQKRPYEFFFANEINHMQTL